MRGTSDEDVPAETDAASAAAADPDDADVLADTDVATAERGAGVDEGDVEEEGGGDARTLPADTAELEELAAFGAQFELDTFQLRAVRHLRQGKSVLVCAPTSAGKSMVGEFALWRALKEGGRAVYTSPIKALSNQKYRELSAKFGGDVGLLTGDVSIKPNAGLLVMTAEVLRLLLIRADPLLSEIRAAVLDEAHFVTDRARGFVWEETVSLLPPSVQLVLLSATVANARELANWVGHAHGADGGADDDSSVCELVLTKRRPVPLRHFVAPAGGGGMFLVRDGEGPVEMGRLEGALALAASNPKQRTAAAARAARLEAAAEVMEGLRQNSLFPCLAFFPSRLEADLAAEAALRKYGGSGGGGGGEGGCGEAAERGTRLLTEEESAVVAEIVDAAFSQLSDEDLELPQLAASKALLCAGIGAHHAGALPVVRELSELLFAEGHLKLLCATETLAMGVNLPARSVVLSSVSKWDGQARRLLAVAEYAQMAGRAGRRGADTAGSAVLLLDGSSIGEGLPPPDAPALAALFALRAEPLGPQPTLAWPALLSSVRGGGDGNAGGESHGHAAGGGGPGEAAGAKVLSLASWLSSARLRSLREEEEILSSQLSKLEVRLEKRRQAQARARAGEVAKAGQVQAAMPGAGAQARGVALDSPGVLGTFSEASGQWDEAFRTRRELWRLTLRFEAAVRSHCASFLQPGRLVRLRLPARLAKASVSAGAGAAAVEAAEQEAGVANGEEVWAVLLKARSPNPRVPAEEARRTIAAAAAAAAATAGALPSLPPTALGKAAQVAAGADGGAFLDIALVLAAKPSAGVGGVGGAADAGGGRGRGGGRGGGGGRGAAGPAPLEVVRVAWSALTGLSPVRLWLLPDLQRAPARAALAQSLSATSRRFGGAPPLLDPVADMGARLELPALPDSKLSLAGLVGRIEALERRLFELPPYATLDSTPPRDSSSPSFSHEPQPSAAQAPAGTRALESRQADRVLLDETGLSLAFEAARVRARLASSARGRVALLAQGGRTQGPRKSGAAAAPAMTRVLRTLGLLTPVAGSVAAGGPAGVVGTVAATSTACGSSAQQQVGQGRSTQQLLLTAKGRAACEFNTADGLLCAELLLGGGFARSAPGEPQAGGSSAGGAAAGQGGGSLLSVPEACAVLATLANAEGPQPRAPPTSERAAELGAKMSAKKASASRESATELPAELRSLHARVLAAASGVLAACGECVFGCDEEAYVGALSAAPMAAARAWAAGSRFGEAAALSDEMVGMLIRTLRSVGELAAEFARAAAALGDETLVALFERCTEAVQRGLVCAPSLYIPGEGEFDDDEEDTRAANEKKKRSAPAEPMQQPASAKRARVEIPAAETLPDDD